MGWHKVLLIILFIIIPGLLSCSGEEVVSVIPAVEVPQDVFRYSGEWIKYSGNPVIAEQSSESWFQWIGDPYVMRDGDTYKMWFGANVKNGITQIGYATSLDGIKWQIYPEPVVKVGEQGQWDDFSVETPSVIKNKNGTYEMWYTGCGGAPEDEAAGWDRLHKIGYAVSDDGISWKKHPKPVMDIEVDKASKWQNFDFAGKADPMVIKQDNTYKMWYSGAGINEKDQMIIKIGLATSIDGINWERLAKPVLVPGNGKVWDAGSVAIPAVIYDGESYYLFYTGKADPEKGNESGAVGLAVSADGINWQKVSSGPYLDKGGNNEFDSSGLWGVSALWDKGIYKIWYSGLKLDNDIHVSLGYANYEKD